MNESSHQNQASLRLDGLHVSLGIYPILHDIHLDCGPGVLGVCGVNGSGKSTLLRTLAGIHEPTQGSISVCGHDLAHEPVEAKRQLGYVPEHAELYPYLSCREICDTVSVLRGAQVHWEQHLKPLGLSEQSDARLSTLSAGQQRKVTMVAALCGEPAVLLLDEPTKALDQQARGYLDKLIEEWMEKERLVVIASHLFSYLEERCTHYLFLQDGRQVAFGSVTKLQQEAKLPDSSLQTLAQSYLPAYASSFS
ncbi:MAG: ABC transporter ATP-binding protein [Deltaproteobacteria bacterium]|nr:MAG: ABC transporter ATP-binding protein [Deltaproteobacteria bacterium]